MTPSEAEWLGAYNRLSEVLGQPHADIFVSRLANRDDIAGVKGDIAAVEDDIARIKDDIAGVKGDIAGVKGDIAGVKDDIAGVKSDIAGINQRFDKLEDRFHRFEDVIREQQRFYASTLVWAMVGSMTVLTAIFSAVVTFLG